MNTGGAAEGMAGTNAEDGMEEPGETDAPGEMNAEGGEVADNCLFDEAEAGKGPGKQIEDFPLEMWNGDRFDFHTNCGGDRKSDLGLSVHGWWGLRELCTDRAGIL